MSELLFETRVEPGASWSHVLKRHTAMRLTDIEGGANVSMMLYNYENLAERLNIPDTLKAQHTAKLTTGHVLYSEMGRVLCSIVADSVGWHDPLAGHSHRDTVEKKYGVKNYQQHRNDRHKNAHDGFLIELGKYGMSERDMVANINFFSKVVVANDGSMSFIEANSKAGDVVELRSEMNTLVIMNTCIHPMTTTSEYSPKPVKVGIYKVPAPSDDDLCRNSCPENIRGFINTERYFM